MSDNKTWFNVRHTTAVEFLNTFFITVVLCLHQSMYTAWHISLLRTYNVDLYFQKMAVGGFFFLSGLKLTQSKSKTSLSGFIKNRFFKIYLLYFFAVISYSIIVYPYINLGLFPDYQNVIIHALGIQSILPSLFGNDFVTLWFISILFLFYLFFMLTRKLVRKKSIFIIIIFASILAVLAIHNYGKYKGSNFLIFRKDICIYLVYFGSGMLYFIIRRNIEKINTGILFFALIFGLIGSLHFFTLKSKIYVQELITIVSYIVSNISFYILVFKSFQKYQPPAEIKKLIQYMSFTSFCVFLFHRPIWSIMNFLWFNVSLFHTLYIIVLGPVCIFVCCFRLQSGYNILMRKLGVIN